MGSLKVLIFQYARDIWRRRWYAVGVAWAICLVGWIVVSRMPDIYESSARVYMNSDEALTPLLRGIAVESDVERAADVALRGGGEGCEFAQLRKRDCAIRGFRMLTQLCLLPAWHRHYALLKVSAALSARCLAFTGNQISLCIAT